MAEEEAKLRALAAAAAQAVSITLNIEVNPFGADVVCCTV